jgi:hypothetical protein
MMEERADDIPQLSLQENEVLTIVVFIEEKVYEAIS